MYSRSYAWEKARAVAQPVRPVAFTTLSSRSPNHFKMLGHRHRGSNAARFIAKAAFMISMLVGLPILFVLGTIYGEDPGWMWVILWVVCLAMVAFTATLLARLWQQHVPVLVKWCNRSQTITYVFTRRLGVQHYVFAYADCVGFRAEEWDNGEASGTTFQMAIRLGAKGMAGTGFRARRGEERKFVLSPAEGRFGPLLAPIRWSDAAPPVPAPRSHTPLNDLVMWIGALIHEMELGPRCMFFDLASDNRSLDELEALRRSITEVTGLPADVAGEPASARQTCAAA
jgi:hypothetical protein